MHSQNAYYYSADCSITKAVVKHCILNCPHFHWSPSAGRYICAINRMVPPGEGRQARAYQDRGLTRAGRVIEIGKKYGVA